MRTESSDVDKIRSNAVLQAMSRCATPLCLSGETEEDADEGLVFISPLKRILSSSHRSGATQMVPLALKTRGLSESNFMLSTEQHSQPCMNCAVHCSRMLPIHRIPWWLWSLGARLSNNVELKILANLTHARASQGSKTSS